MKEITLIWQVGHTSAPQQKPAEMYPATVPGAAQLDYARAHNWPPVEEGVNFRDYAWMEDVYWLYTAPLDFTLEEDEVATLRFLGIDYRYRIQVGNQILAEGEGMFSPVFCGLKVPRSFRKRSERAAPCCVCGTRKRRSGSSPQL